MTSPAPGSPPSLETLLRRFRETGDSDGLGALFDRTAPGLFRLALATARDAATAEDALQETFLAVISGADRWDPTRPVLPWLVAILHNEVESLRRSTVRRERRQVVAARAEAGLTEADAPPASAEAADRLHAALEALPRPYREVALLRWRYGLDPAEIAHVREEPPGTTRSLLSRALERLRAAMRGLPALFFNGREPCGLAAIRRHVMEKAAGSPLAVPTAAIGGALVAKKAVFGVVVVLLLAGAWLVARPAGRPTTTQEGSRPAAANAIPAGEEGSGRAALASVPPRAPKAAGTAPAEARVTGRVVGPEGDPVAGARVIAYADDLASALRPEDAGRPGSSARAAVAEASGRFSVALPEGAPSFTLYAEAASASPEVVRGVRAGEDVLLRLGKGNALFGRVLDVKNRPVEGARVRAFRMMDAVRVEKVAVSGAAGAYRVEGLPSWGFSVEVSAAGFAPLLVTRVRAGRTEGEDAPFDLVLVEGATLEVKVVDGETGARVEGARVRLWSIEGQGSREGRRMDDPSALRLLGEGRSGTDGMLEFAHVPAEGFHPLADLPGLPEGRASALLCAWKEGLAPVCSGVLPSADGARIEARLSLWPAASMRGRVVDAEGKPVANASVLQWVEGRRDAGWLSSRLMPEAPPTWRKTDAEGRYRLDSIRAARAGPTTVHVHAARSRFPALEGRGEGATMVDRAETTVAVTPGSTSEVPDLVLPTGRSPAIDVEVVDPAGRPIWGAEATILRVGPVGRTDADGRLHVLWPTWGGRVIDDVTLLSVGAPGRASTIVKVDPSVEAPPNVRVTLGPAHRVAGTVRLRSGRLTGAAVYVVDGRIPLSRLLPDGARSLGEAWILSQGAPGLGEHVYGSAVASPDGSFELDSLPEGPYLVAAEYFESSADESPKVVRSVVSDVASDATGVALVLDAGDPMPRITGAIEGTVVDAAHGDPVVKFSVSLLTAPEPTFAEATRPGAFRVGTAPVGRWTLRVTAPGYLRREIEGVEVRAGATPPPIRVALERGATVSGRVVALGGISLKGRAVRFAPVASFAQYSEDGVNATLDESGAFRAIGLKPGKHRVICYATNVPTPQDPHLVPAGGEAVEVPAAGADVRFDVAWTAAGILSVQPSDPRLPAAPAYGGAQPSEEERRFGTGSRVEILDAAGTVIARQVGLHRDDGGGATGNVILAPGRYVVRLSMPAGETREERVDLVADRQSFVSLSGK